MSRLVIKGYMGRKIFAGNNDYKIYSFYPTPECEKMLKMNKYGNITICGTLPELLEEKEYTFEVDYVRKGNYDNYVVNKLINNKEKITLHETVIFLQSLCSEKVTQNIVSAYPDIIELLINNKDDEIDLSKINGVGKKKLTKIKNKVVENYVLFDVISEFHEYDLTFSQIKKIQEKYPSIELLREKMEENPYKCLCSLSGIGFKIADAKILNKNNELRNSLYRMRECAYHVLKENESNGDTWISLKQLFDKCIELANEATIHFMKIIKEDSNLYFNETEKTVARKSTYLCEIEIAEKLTELISKSKLSNFDTKKYDNVNSIPLTEKQKLILEYVNKYGISILSGFGGTGKSFSSKALIDMLEDANESYFLLAPTGKASKVMSQYIGRRASTIHRGLVYNPKKGFQFNEKEKLPYKYVIVDEAGMIDCFLMRDLLRAIDTDQTKVVFVCDPAQIPSVGAGNCMQDMINSGVIPTVFLDEVFRYGEGGLSYVATKVRQGEKFLNSDSNKLQIFGKNKDFAFIPRPNEVVLDSMVSLYNKMLQNGIDRNDIMIISSYNKGEFGTYNINRIIQNIINPKMFEDEMEKKYIREKEEIVFRIGDRVMQTKNDYKATIFSDNVTVNIEELDIEVEEEDATTSVFNGDEGIIICIEKDYMVVDFDGIPIKYSDEKIKNLLLSYSISTHKSQGSSYSHVIVVTPTSHKFFLNRNLLYVAFTRARNKVYDIGTIDTIESALKKSENLRRRTFLEGLLRNSLI